MRDGLEGEGLERVAGEDGDGLAEGDVAGRLAAAQVVVVERGEIVVDERVGVQHLERGTQFGDSAGQFAAACDHARGLHAEDGPQPLAAGEDAVAHRAVDGVGQCLGRGKKPFEGSVGEGDAGGKQRAYGGIHLPLMINELRGCAACRLVRGATCDAKGEQSELPWRGRMADIAALLRVSSSFRQKYFCRRRQHL